MYTSLTRVPYTRGTSIVHLLGVKNYSSNYFVLYTSLTRTSYTRGTRIPRLLEVRNHLNNYFTMYARLTRSRIHAELISRDWLGLNII